MENNAISFGSRQESCNTRYCTWRAL